MVATPGQGLPTWRKSSFSGKEGGGGSCVEVAALADGTVAIRNSTAPAAGTARFTRVELRAWVAGIKDGEFDDLA